MAETRRNEMTTDTLMISHQIETPFEELASRECNGIHVSLLWKRNDNSLTVVVSDTIAAAEFELEVGSAPALDVFNHPYAYQAYRVDENTRALKRIDTAPAVA
jgi:hypothetical protein